MRKLLIANWKMKMRQKPAVEFAKVIRKSSVKGIDLVVAPSLLQLPEVGSKLKGGQIALAAQNVAAWDKGSYTGEVSARMLKDAGCKYVIIGHSERRQMMGETDEMVNQKIGQALAVNLQPILCIGETAEENKAGKRDMVLMQQLKKALTKQKGLCDKKMVIAYEPVWAIGSGKTVQQVDLDAAYKIVKRTVSMICSSTYFDEKIRFVYGGSIDGSNVNEFWPIDYVDGFLVGGASLKVKDFLSIAEAYQQ